VNIQKNGQGVNHDEIFSSSDLRKTFADVMALNIESSIPSEIIKFFKMFPGQTLLIKGKPGTGKTILSFGILKEICEKRNGLYLSMRVTPEKLYNLFPWIKEVVPERNVVNATPKKLNEVLESLNYFPGQPFDFDAALNFFKMLYENAEDMDNPVVVIDSWDALLGYLNLQENSVSFTQSICDFCHDVGTHLILISETDGPTDLDYIVDGVVTLLDTNVRGEAMDGQPYLEHSKSRTLREIRIDKLRGVERKRRSYVFTLNNGQFRHFPPYDKMQIAEIEPLPDIDETHRSSGIKDFDEITGGLEKGGLTLFVVEHSVGLRYVPFLDQIAINLALKGIGVARLRSVGSALPEDYELTKRYKEIYFYKPESWATWQLEKLFPSAKEYRKFLETIRKDKSDLMEFSLMEARKEYHNFLQDLRRKHSMIVEFLGLDTFEILYGTENTLKLLDEAIARASENNEILIAVAKRGMKSIEMITQLAAACFVFKDIVGSLFIYGEQPRTGLYNISSDEKGIHLTPVI